MPLARRLASRYQRRSESFEDLVQVANLQADLGPLLRALPARERQVPFCASRAT